MPKYIKSMNHVSKKKGLFRSKNTVHLSLLSFFFVMDFLDSFLGPRTPLIPRSRFAPSNPLEYSDITKDFWLILVSWALITLCSRFKSTCKINSKPIEINLMMEKFVKWRKSRSEHCDFTKKFTMHDFRQKNNRKQKRVKNLRKLSL